MAEGPVLVILTGEELRERDEGRYRALLSAAAPLDDSIVYGVVKFDQHEVVVPVAVQALQQQETYGLIMETAKLAVEPVVRVREVR